MNSIKKKNYKYKKIDLDFQKLLRSIRGQTLHAFCLGFLHPRSLKKLEFEVELPKNFKKLVNFLDKLKN